MRKWTIEGSPTRLVHRWFEAISRVVYWWCSHHRGCVNESLYGAWFDARLHYAHQPRNCCFSSVLELFQKRNEGTDQVHLESNCLRTSPINCWKRIDHLSNFQQCISLRNFSPRSKSFRNLPSKWCVITYVTIEINRVLSDFLFEHCHIIFKQNSINKFSERSGGHSFK